MNRARRNIAVKGCMLAGLLCLFGGAFWFLRNQGELQSTSEGVSGERTAFSERRSSAVGSIPGTRFTGRVGLPEALFSFVKRPDWADRLEARLPAPAHGRVQYVRPERKLLTDKNSPFWKRKGEGRITVDTPEGRQLQVILKGSRQVAPDRIISEGWVEGQPSSRFILTAQEVEGGETQITMTLMDVCLADPDDPAAGEALQSFTMRATGAGEAQYYRIDDARVPACGGELLEGRLALARAAIDAASSAPKGRTAAEDAALASGAPITIDLLMLYTNGIVEGQGSGTTASRVAAVQSTLEAAVAEANSDLARSGVGVQLRLVKMAQVSYDETASDYSRVNSDALKALRLPADGKMDEVHALRNEVGADLVSLAVMPRDNGSSGIGYLLSTPTLVDTGESFFNDQYAFTVVQYHALTGTSLLSHELGHNMGAQHDRENSKDNTGALAQGAFSYSYGYRFYGRNGVQYRTIMAYSPGTRVHYYSNPGIVASESIIGVPVGIAVGAAGESHNALTIQRCAFETSGYRLQKVDTADKGMLVNVSTRAWVGVGERQMIGGFMVEGSASKRVLLRAVGGSLGSFGVAGVLANPRLVLYRLPSGTRIAENDDWAGQGSATEISTLAASIGAFPLSSSSDSALLLNLEPGVYSANIEASDSTTGIAMLEAYDVDASQGPRLVNLSTRAWSETGKPIIAGFAVRGTAGQTKRTLIRVLGPTLSQYGISEAMSDPRLDLYRADGTWVMANDDWSSGAAYVSGQRDDFSPLVEYYSEKAIYSTGLAPKNRREPAMLVDLEPGVYTAIVKPFESESSQQTASPGVAIVEVYEIKAP